MADPYAANIIKKYKHWTIYLHADQGFIGRCVVWCNRPDALDLADATKDEQKELFIVLHDIREAVKKRFGATWFNYSFLGNVDRHLHGHFFPRYQEPVIFNGIEFRDSDYNQNPSKTTTTNIVSDAMRAAIKDELAQNLSSD